MTSVDFDPNRIRKDFPTLAQSVNGKPLVYLDNAATSQKPRAVLDAQVAYWRRRLAGAPALELATDRPRPPIRTYRGATVPIQLPAELSGRLRELGRRQGATLFMILLAAFQVLLSRLSGQQDVLVGSPVAGRGERRLEELIGLFVNTLVLRADLSGRPSFAQVLRQARDVVLAAQAHQDVPFERLVFELEPTRDLSRSPLFQAMLAMQDRALADVEFRPDPLHRRRWHRDSR